MAPRLCSDPSGASTINYSLCVQQPGSLTGAAHVLHEEDCDDGDMQMERHMDRMELQRMAEDEEGTTLISETSRSESVSVSLSESSHSVHSSDEDSVDSTEMDDIDAASRTPSKQYLIQIDSVDSHARTAMEMMYRKANSDGDSLGMVGAMDGVEVAAERVAVQQAQLYEMDCDSLSKRNRAYYVASPSSENDEEDDDLKREEMTHSLDSLMTSSFSPRQSVDEAEEDEHTQVLSGNVTIRQSSGPYSTFLSLPRSADSLASTEYTVSASSTNCTGSSTMTASVSGSASIITMSGSASSSASDDGYPNYLIKGSTAGTDAESEYYGDAIKSPF